MPKLSPYLFLLFTLVWYTYAQTIYVTEFEYSDSTCQKPYRYARHDPTCSYGMTALRCDTTATTRLCKSCESNSTCSTMPLNLNNCVSGQRTTCTPSTPLQPSTDVISYLEYSDSSCGLNAFSSPGLFYNQTKNQCVGGTTTFVCLANGVQVKNYRPSTSCGIVAAENTYPFGVCAKIFPEGSTYYKFIGCIPSSSANGMDSAFKRIDLLMVVGVSILSTCLLSLF